MRFLLALIALLISVSAAHARTAAEAYALALDAEVARGDLPKALELFREAARAPAGELHNDAVIASARVLLRQEDLKAFNQALNGLPPARALTAGQAAEVARLKRARDEQLREPKRPAPSPAPPKATRDVSLTESTLEDATVALSNLYGVTLVVHEPSTARVNLQLRGVTFHQALLALVFHAGLDARRAGGIYYVGTPKKLATYFAAPAAATATELFAADAMSRPTAPASSVTLELQNALVPEVLRRLVEGFGVNVVGPATTQRVTLDFSRVGLDGALRSVASQLGWEIRRVNDMYFLGSGSHLVQYFPGFERRYLRLRHVSAGEIYDQVQEFLVHERLRLARIEVDIVGNALIIEGDKVDLDRVERFLAQEDVTQQSVSLELYLKDFRTAPVTESPRKRIRMLAGQMGIVTLEADLPEPSVSVTASAPTTGTTTAAPAVGPRGQMQLMVEITPRLKPASQIAFELHWRLTTLKGGQIVDVQESPPTRVTATGDAALEVPVVVAEGGKPRLALVLKPGD